MRPLVRTEEGEWRSRPRKAAIPRARVIQMRQALLDMNEDHLLIVARRTLGVKVRKEEAYLLVDKMLNHLEAQR